MSFSEDKFNRLLGKKLQDARKNASLTQKEVAAHFKVSQDSISCYEQGKVSVTASKLLSFSRLYKKPVSFFFMNSQDLST